MYARKGLITLGLCLPVHALELLQERDERIDPRFGKRVVDRGPEPADRAVSLEPVEPGGGRFLRELLLEILGRQTERHVHPGSRILFRVPAIEAGAIDLRI